MSQQVNRVRAYMDAHCKQCRDAQQTLEIASGAWDAAIDCRAEAVAARVEAEQLRKETTRDLAAVTREALFCRVALGVCVIVLVVELWRHFG